MTHPAADLRPFSLDGADLELAHELSSDSGRFVVRPHTVPGAPSWALVRTSWDGDQTVLLGDSREEVEAQAERLRQTWHLRSMLDAKGVGYGRWDDLMEAVRAAADQLGCGDAIDQIHPMAFVEGWLRHSDSLAAGWVTLSAEAVERMVGAVLRKRHLA